MRKDYAAAAGADLLAHGFVTAHARPAVLTAWRVIGTMPAMAALPSSKPAATSPHDYVLERQVGHLLRRAHQRASAIFAARMAKHQLTPTQFATLAKLTDEGAASQNRLGRLTAMDPATMQGVILRLMDRGLISRAADPKDRRRAVLRLTDEGRRVFRDTLAIGKAISQETLAPLDAKEQALILKLLSKLG